MKTSNQSSDRDGGDKKNRKTSQLCRQIYIALCQSLAGLGDEIFLDVSVESVVPAPDASRLLVLVVLQRQARSRVDEVYDALERARGSLRADVAAAITRKRAPELAFLVRPQTEVQI